MPYKVYQTQPADVKVEAEGSSTEVEMEMAEPDANGTNGTEKTKSLPWLNKVKEAGVKKVPKKVLKMRRNFKLKRILVPKSPSMLLYEVVGSNEVKFGPFEVNKINNTVIISIEATYDGRTFQGAGPSKSVAKNVCAEQVLQHYVFKACTQVKIKSEEGGDVEMTEGREGGGPKEDPTPWTALASLGLFKLFNDWQSQGVQLPPELLLGPALRTMAATDQPNLVNQDPQAAGAVPAAGIVPMTATVKREKKPKAPKPKQLPENAHTQHAVMLLNQMVGPLEYECTTDGVIPNTMFTVTVTVNGCQFSGASKTKKEAKKLAAQAAMTAIYDVQYPAPV